MRPAQASHLLLAQSRLASAKTLPVSCLPHPHNRVLGRPYLAHATAARTDQWCLLPTLTLMGHFLARNTIHVSRCRAHLLRSGARVL